MSGVRAGRDNALIVSERDIDLFAGPGGWDEGAAELGVRPLGIEWDDAACATRRARGHETLQADVSALDPQDFAPVRLLIASAPCQAFSMAGLGAGRRALQAYIDAIEGLLKSGVVDRESLDEKCEDERGHLVLEPLRWAMQLRPRFVALEQVEPVLPLWEAIAGALRRLGYGTWTGVLSAERYGVPQTRKRAILLAKLGGVVSEPPATHQRYVPPRVKAKQEESLFEAPDPERIVAPEDRELLPWVSMAEALGWGMTARPFPVVANHHSDGGMDYSCVGGSGARQRVYDERDSGRWVVAQERVAGPSRDLEPRSVDDPSYTIRTATGSGDAGVGRTPGVQWVTETEPPAEPTHYDSRAQRDGRTRALNRRRSVGEPTPTIAGESRNDSWVHDRPATTVAGDPRVFPPGHKLNDEDLRAGRGGQQRSGRGWAAQRPSTTVADHVGRLPTPGAERDHNEKGDPKAGKNAAAVRVSVAEASVLQSFSADYPWQGTRTAQYRQIGDAVPPFLARACLAHLLR